MPKVFTFAAVRRYEVPSVNAFEPLANAYRRWLPRQEWFAGGILLGSVLQGTHTHRSDIDLLIVFKEGCAQTATRALAEFRREYAGFVPVNINLWSEREIQNGVHTIGHGFLAHLTWAAENGGLIGRSPIQDITLKQRHSAQNDLESYIAHKMEKLRDFSCEQKYWTEQECHVLENVGMAPLHATRRWLSLQGYADDALRKKEDVVALLEKHCPSSGKRLGALLAADAAYEQALNEYLKRFDTRTYLKALNKLSTRVGDAATFIASLADVTNLTNK